MAADFALEGIDHVAFSVSDQRSAIEWYTDVLGLERRFADAWGDHPAVLCAGETCVALFPADGPGRASDSGPGFRHLAFRVSRADLETAQAELDRRGIEWRFSDHDVSHSIYFTDPDGNQLELTTYEV